MRPTAHQHRRCRAPTACAAGVAGLALAAALLGLLPGQADAAGAQAASATALPSPGAAPTAVDGPLAALEVAGRAQPADTAARLGAWLARLAADHPQRALLLGLRGFLQSTLHDAQATDDSLRELDSLTAGRPLAAAAAGLVRAAQARDVGPLRQADRLAGEALVLMPAHAPDALRWRLLNLHARIKEDRAEFDEALRLHHQALALADKLGAPWRRCETRTGLAYTLMLAGQTERGRAVNAESIALARSGGDDVAIARALSVESFFLAEAGDAVGELSAMQGSIRHARQGGSRQDEVLGLANLADHYLKRSDFNTALALSREALPLARAAGDRTGESVALANIGLALISLRQPAEGLRFTRESMALDERVGALSSMARFELEIGSYLERAGYLREAVAAFQRQRKLADEVSRRDQQQAILELQEGQDHERRQRELELLQRENDLQQARLLNQTLTQRLWAAAALAALLLLAVAALLLHRLRRHNAALKEGNALLRTLSEHDALTGLANRHHLHRVRHAAPGGASAPFEGSLLLIDIDHFKRINDRHGHAAGDAVLVETARRLRGVLRDGDLIVRWGGEEFLVVAHALSQAQLEALAQRLLCAVADQPVALDGQAVAVTASIGYASFPTQPTRLAVTWERALALVDTALYLAKAHGRNLAYGVWQLHAQDENELVQISHGLEAAWREGRVQLTASRGPGVAVPPAPAPDLAPMEIGALRPPCCPGSEVRKSPPAGTAVRLRGAAGALALLLALAGPPALAMPETAASRFDAVLLLAETAPDQARVAAAQPVAAAPASPDITALDIAAQSREQALLRAWVAARIGEPESTMTGLLAALAAASAAVAPRLADADAPLVRALVADREGRLAAEGLARQALAAYETHCGAQPRPQADCEYRGRWQARQLLAQHAAVQQATDQVRSQAQAAAELAAAGHDRRRQAWSESQLALAAAHSGDAARAASHLDQARALAGRRADSTLQQRLAATEAALARERHDPQRAGAALQRMLALAREGGSALQQAVALANLSDHAVKNGAPQRGLTAAEQGLALLDPQQRLPVRSALLNNAMLARVALGRLAEARRDFDLLQAAWGETGANGRQLVSLREFSDALAVAGDLTGALEMHHREQALADRLMAANRDAALAELRTRFDREAQQRHILLLARDNALTTAAVANQLLNQRLWATAGGVLALAGVLMLLLVRRVRETRRKLEHNQAHLRVQSERDALTGVASRRHAQALMRSAGSQPGGFAGALLMIDIDHFKQINDGHGHAVGDQVLAEVARRVATAVRPQDLVARWGGEEFLVHAPGLLPAEAEALVRRLLQAVSGTPVRLAAPGPDGPDLRVTVSIGHGVFPLAPHRVPLVPEQAINLVDMALYTAKSQGRHRAVGITACAAERPDDLRAVEADFERAWQNGRIGLRTETGPGPGLDDGLPSAGPVVAAAVAAVVAAPGGPVGAPAPEPARAPAVGAH